MVKNLPATAGDMGSIPDPGRFLTLWGTGTDVPQLLSLCFRVRALQQEKPLQEAHAPQLERARSQQQRPSTAKNKSINKQTKELSRDFPGGPVVRAPCFYCRGNGFQLCFPVTEEEAGAVS